MIVVFDASTAVSASLKEDSVPERPLLLAIGAPNRVIISQEVEDEYREGADAPQIRPVLNYTCRQRLLDIVMVKAERVEPIEQVRECADPHDDKYLSLAAVVGADVIVSGDERHLLPMHPWRGISIVLPSAFMLIA